MSSRIDKIVTVRFNEYEQKQLEYCMKNSGHYTYCVSALIKDLISEEYRKLLNKNNKRL